jgi:cold shock CspA family protein
MSGTATREGATITGRIVRFEAERGYGFVTPDDGGEDIFVHANDLSAVPAPVACGTRLAFRVVDGGRGPKAYDVRPLSTAAPAAAASPAGPAAAAAAPSRAEGECEVLTEREFVHEVTELILDADGGVTAAQAVAIRRRFADFARANGWID